MSDLLGIGVSGVRAYQAALNTTSENIANAGVEGYARRTTDLREVSAPGTLTNSRINGLGVVVDGVSRASDQFRVNEVRIAGGELARSETSAAWLERIEGALSGSRLSDRLTDFFNAARGVAADPSASGPRAGMLESAAGVASAFASTGNALAAAAADLDAAIDADVARLNTLATTLAGINSGLARGASGTSQQALLLDERDRVLQAMSELVNIHVDHDSLGRATVRAGDFNGPVLVTGDRPSVVSAAVSGGAVSYSVFYGGATNALAATSGAFAGHAEAAQRIDAAQTELNALATSFVTDINALQAAGEDLFGDSGAAMFTIGDRPTSIALAITDPRAIAAATPGAGPRDGGNLAALNSLRATGNYEGRVTDLIAGNANALSGRRAVSDAQRAIRDAAVAARDSVSAVNLDEEAVELIRFQQAFQAASRVIQVARETFDAIYRIG